MKKHTISELKSIATQKGGECLSEKYFDQLYKYEWRCACGNTWKTSFKNVKDGNWCPKCGIKLRAKHKTKYTIDDVQKIAASHGGVCLSRAYVNSKTYLQFRCAEGHTFWSSPICFIHKNNWCNDCANVLRSAKHMKHTLEDVRRVVEERGGVLLSTKYKKCSVNMEIKCGNGHTFKKSFSKLLAGRWCPQCTKYFNEEKCRFILGQIFQRDFPKHRIEKTEFDRRFELDGYCEELKLAFEYNGAQHYRYVKYFHRSRDGFKKVKERDVEKRLMCSRMGIKLIDIPYDKSEKDDRLVRFIFRQLRKLGFNEKTRKIDFSGFYQTLYNLNELKEIAREKGGECISEEFLGMTKPLIFRCAEGHTWPAAGTTIKQGHWCPACFGRNKTIDTLKKAAEEKGGVCLSNEYKGAGEHYWWKCAQGHTWEAVASSILRGMWCRKCAHEKNTIKQRLSVEEVRKIAHSQNVEFLEAFYENARTKYKWRCSCGDIWEATLENISKGHKCRKCKNQKIRERLTDYWKTSNRRRRK